MNNNSFYLKIAWIFIFSIAMAFAESAVVVYLRAIFYPEGFSFPLKAMVDYKILVEIAREAATMLMLMGVSFFAGRSFWERFAYFVACFGIWDIFYYVWLKVLLDWPPSLLTWDVLFLIPLPWIGPVIAPASIAILMTIFGISAARLFHSGKTFRLTIPSQILALAGIIIVLYSFIYDTEATLHQQVPRPYRYDLLILSDLLFAASFIISYAKYRGNSLITPNDS